MGITSLKSKIVSFLNRGTNTSKSDPSANNAKSFVEQQKAEVALDRRELGLREVAVDKIVGSVGRYHDFDGKFRSKKNHKPHKLKLIKEALRQKRKFPPVDLYKIKDEYYVLDGNHRVSATRELQQPTIQAHIVEYLPSKQTLENILYREKAKFEFNTGLTDKIELTEVGQFAYLMEQITEH